MQFILSLKLLLRSNVLQSYLLKTVSDQALVFGMGQLQNILPE